MENGKLCLVISRRGNKGDTMMNKKLLSIMDKDAEVSDPEIKELIKYHYQPAGGNNK